MKINILSIVRDHFGTLYDVKSRRLSVMDLCVFYWAPLLICGCAWVMNFKVTQDTFNVSITFFGIFIALLLNIQVAMFSIFQRKWKLSSDDRTAERQIAYLSLRKILITELNINLSYLVLISCLLLVICFAAYAMKWTDGIVPAITLGFYVHFFMLTLLMLIKRAHALFHKEYRDSPEDWADI